MKIDKSMDLFLDEMSRRLAMGRKDDIWYPLESGFVYPRPLSEFGF